MTPDSDFLKNIRRLTPILSRSLSVKMPVIGRFTGEWFEHINGAIGTTNTLIVNERAKCVADISFFFHNNYLH